MRKRNPFLMAILGIAVLSGVLFSGVILATGIREGMAHSAKASSAAYRQAQPYQLEKTRLDDFSELSMQLDDANVSILPADGYYLEYRLDGIRQEPTYEVSNGKFCFQEGAIQRQFQIGWNLWGTMQEQEPFYLNLYVPEGQVFDTITMDLESGNLEVGNLEVKKASFRLDYGNFTSDTLAGEDLTICAESGNLDLGDVACEKLNIQADYGNLSGGQFAISKRADFSLESGNLELSSLSGDSLKLSSAYGNCAIDTFQASNSSILMDSGNVTLLDAAFDTAEIQSEYGDVEIQLADGVQKYNYDLETEYGSITIDGTKIEEDEDGTATYATQDEKIKKLLQIHGESGNVRIR